MRRRAVLAGLAATLFGGACGARDRESGVETAASANASARAAGAEGRLVVAGGALTEIVYALGAGDRVVGVDTSSSFPSAVEKLPKVGYQRQLAAEGILSLGPELLLVSEEAGPAPVLAQLAKAGVRVERVAAPRDAGGIPRRLREVGELLGREAEAERLAESSAAELEKLLARSRARGPKVRALFLYARGQGTLLVGGKETAADLVFELAGLENGASSIRGFEALSAEALVGARPELVVVPEKGLASLGGVEGLFALPGMAQTPAAATKRVVAVDDLLLLGLGPRTASAIERITREVYGA